MRTVLRCLRSHAVRTHRYVIYSRFIGAASTTTTNDDARVLAIQESLVALGRDIYAGPDHASGSWAAIGSNPLKRSGKARCCEASKRARARARPHFTRSLDENDFACTGRDGSHARACFPRIPVAHFSTVRPHDDRSFFAVTPRRARSAARTRKRGIRLRVISLRIITLARPTDEGRSNDVCEMHLYDHAVTNFESVMPLPRVLDRSLAPTARPTRRL